MEIRIHKKDGSVEPYNEYKIVLAIEKACDRANFKIDEDSFDSILDHVADYYSDSMKNVSDVYTRDMHAVVINVLRAHGFNKVADAYQEYRDYKNTYATEFEHLRQQADGVILLGDNENANFDSSLISTKGSLIKGYLTKSLYKQFYLSKKEKELTKRGDIYIHDLRDMLLGSVNCCLFDMANVLKNGFEMSNVVYTEPKSVLTALQVIGDITLVASAQQFGGFTIPEIDKVLLPYCKKTYYKAIQDYYKLCPDGKGADKYAFEVLQKELEQGFQSLELKLNTVPSSRGDFAFTTLTFGHIPREYQTLEKQMMQDIAHAILETRRKGHGGKRVVFPKLVYLYDDDNVKKDAYSFAVFHECVVTSSECLYPDYLSLTGNPEHNAVAQTYFASQKQAIVSPMGCRAYLSPWKDPETNRYVTIGRFNIGAVSLNLPILVAIAKKEGDVNRFWSILKDRLDVCREFLKKRYDFLSNVKAGTNPMAFCQGGFYGGNLSPESTISPCLRYATASFGITAIDEASRLLVGVGLDTKEGQDFAKQVLTFINNYIDIAKKEDGHLYALYGTPAESLCETQARQYFEYTGDPQFGKYFSNSFHCNVKADITPIEKQDWEEEAFHMCNGGHIQYVRLDNPKNVKATYTLIKRGMDKGFYQGVNFDDAYCNTCHKRSQNVLWKCPHCGSEDLTVISRVCGYLGFSNVNGKSRMNDGKMAEIKDRISM